MTLATAAPASDATPATSPGTTAGGFSLVELLVAMTIIGLGLGTVALLVVPVLGAFDADPAAADAAQRGRAAMHALFDDVQRAGSGFVAATADGPGAALPAVWPDGLAIGPWMIGARPQVLSAWHAPRGAAHGVLRADVAAGAMVLPLARAAFCSAATPTCGFQADDEVVVYGPHGRVAAATIRQVLAPLDLELTAPLAEAWAAGAVVSAVRARTYDLRPDPTTGLAQITRRLGAGPATPVVDFVTRFEVTWWLDAGTPRVIVAPPAVEEDASLGPAPPPAGTAGHPDWPLGENCAFLRDGSGAARWRGAGGAATRQPAPLAAFSDGPWCPSAAAAVRWDADLARVVEVHVELGIAAAANELRLGPRRPGARLVPDLQLKAVLVPGRRNGSA